MINIGAYVAGSNPKIDESIAAIDGFNAYLRQGVGEKVSFDEAVEGLITVVG